MSKVTKIPFIVYWKLKSMLDSILVKSNSNGLLFTRFYYGFINCCFDREREATLAGKQEYARKNTKAGDGAMLLRRNVHRLEKGLSMKERREIFALDYLEETVDKFCSLSNKDNSCEKLGDEFRWYCDVLWEYFKVCKGHETIERCREKFKSCHKYQSTKPLAPFLRDLSAPLKCDFEALEQLMERRRSVRFYKNERVPRASLKKAMQIAAQAPSACNRQPFSFRVFDDPLEANEIASYARGTTGYVGQIPCLIVIVGHLDAYFSDRDRHIIYVDASLAAMPFMQACECLGLGTCAINWPDVEQREKAMAKRLKLNKWERPIMLLSVGFPDPDVVVPRSVKKSTEKLLKWESHKQSK